MTKLKDLSAKFEIPSFSEELNLLEVPQIMNNRAGGISLFSDSFKRGYGTAVFGSDSNGIWLGAADFVDAPFSVDMDGALTATSATITGMGQNFVSTIVWTATDIDTATWTAGTIKTSDGTSYAIDAGNTGNIGGDTYIYLDTATSITVLQTSTTATDAAGDGKILIAIVQIGIVGSECIIDVVGSTGTTIDGDKITTGTIVANKLNVTDLAAINANLGTITAGSISGVTIAIGSDNSIFKADSNGIYLGDATFGSAPFSVDMGGNVYLNSYFLNSGNIFAVGNGMGFKNTYGINYYNSANSSLIASLTVNSSNVLRLGNTTGQTSITAGNTEGLLIGTDGYVLMTYGVSIASGLSVSTGNFTVNFGSTSCNAINMNTNNLTGVDNMSCKSISLNNGQNEGSIQNIDTLLGYNDLRLRVPSGGVGSTNRVMFVDSSNNETASIRANDSGKFYSNNSYINLNGTDKLAIVPTSDGYKALYCVESPEVWFFDFCETKESVDSLFLEVTEGEKKFIKVDGGGYQVWRRRKGYGHKRFGNKTAKQFEANEKFLSIPKISD